MKKLIPILTAALLSTNSIASEIKWDSVQLSKFKVKTDELGTFDGRGITGSILAGENLIVKVEKRTYDSSLNIRGYTARLDLELTAIGLGGRSAISEKTDFFFILQHIKTGVRGSILTYSSSVNATGKGAQMGIRSKVSDNIELSAYLNHIDLGEGSTGTVLAADYYLTDHLSLGFSYESESEEKGTGMSIKYSF